MLGLREDDRTFAVAKLFFTFGTGGNLIFPWYVGASCVLFAGPPRVAANVLATIAALPADDPLQRADRLCAALALDNFTTDYDLSQPAPVRLGRRVAAGADLARLESDAPGWTSSTASAAPRVYHIFISNRPGDIRPGSSGKPVDGYELASSTRTAADVPQGEVGNLLVHGRDDRAVLPAPVREEPAHLSAANGCSPATSTYVDADGYYWHAGRSDDMLKVGGIWVSPVEVESTLMAHPAVLECAVVGRTDAADLIKPKAFVVPTSGHEPSDELAAS